MKGSHIRHYFGDDARARVAARFGWLTAGIATSIAWPKGDVFIEYDGAEYLILGVGELAGRLRPPCIGTPSTQADIDASLARLYRFTSILGYFLGGYVDITIHGWGSRVVPISDSPTVPASFTLMRDWEFSCDHMPVINDERTRIALAFLRDGRRLQRVHQPYSFLSFFKVIESQFCTKEARKDWIDENLDSISGDATTRVAQLRTVGKDVTKHLYASGRCAVAHAGVRRETIDPDIPADRNRIAADLPVIAALAERFIKAHAGIPDERDVLNQLRAQGRG